MRCTVRGLTASMIPSATAWRARSRGVQWVVCKPSAIGSRQARATMCGRCRGGTLRGTPTTGIVLQELPPAALLVAAAEPPDRGPVTLQPGSDLPDGRAGGDGQNDAGVLDLEEGQASAVSDRVQDRQV